MSQKPDSNHVTDSRQGPLRETAPAAQRRKQQAPRFHARNLGPEWRAYRRLAQDCEAVELTPFEAQVSRAVVSLRSVEFAAEHLGIGPGLVLKTANAAAQKLRGPGFNRKCREYWREIYQAMRPERGGDSPAQLVGLLPYVDTENHPNWRSYLNTLADPKNYRNTTMRGTALNEHDIELNGATLLVELYR